MLYVNGPEDVCCRLYPFSPHSPGQCVATAIFLLTLHRGCGLAYPYDGREVSWEPKGKRSYSILSCIWLFKWCGNGSNIFVWKKTSKHYGQTLVRIYTFNIINKIKILSWPFYCTMYIRSTLLWRSFIYEEISECSVNKSGNSSWHLRAKGGV